MTQNGAWTRQRLDRILSELFYVSIFVFENETKCGNNDEAEIIEKLSGMDLQIVIGFPPSSTAS